jgi:hypothetical protein
MGALLFDLIGIRAAWASQLVVVGSALLLWTGLQLSSRLWGMLDDSSAGHQGPADGFDPFLDDGIPLLAGQQQQQTLSWVAKHGSSTHEGYQLQQRRVAEACRRVEPAALGLLAVLTRQLDLQQRPPAAAGSTTPGPATGASANSSGALQARAPTRAAPAPAPSGSAAAQAAAAAAAAAAVAAAAAAATPATPATAVHFAALLAARLQQQQQRSRAKSRAAQQLEAATAAKLALRLPGGLLRLPPRKARGPGRWQAARQNARATSQPNLHLQDQWRISAWDASPKTSRGQQGPLLVQLQQRSASASLFSGGKPGPPSPQHLPHKQLAAQPPGPAAAEWGLPELEGMWPWRARDTNSTPAAAEDGAAYGAGGYRWACAGSGLQST